MDTPTVALPKTVRVGNARRELAAKVASELARRAFTELGYRTQAVTNKRARYSAELAQALHDLDIDVLHPRSVERYKRERRRWQNQRSFYRVWGWKSRRLCMYRKAVPDNAIAIALRIKERVPAAEFYIEELVADGGRVDPFLYVTHGLGKYYLAVWEEKGFESR